VDGNVAARILLVFAAILLIFVGFFSPKVQSAEDPNYGRFYVGLGIVIRHEKDGILVGQVYPGSPAQKAGLVSGDLIIGVDGTSAKDISTQKFMYAAKYGKFQSPMVLTVLRRVGDSAVKADLSVKRGFVDQTANIPRDEIFESMCGSSKERLIVSARVSEDTKTGEFTYWHKFTNDSEEHMFVQSELLDRLASGNWNSLQVFHFKPYESREFVLKSKDWPTMKGYSINQLFVATDDSSERISDSGFTGYSLGKDYVMGKGCGLSGFLPERSTKK